MKTRRNYLLLVSMVAFAIAASQTRRTISESGASTLSEVLNPERARI